MVAIMDEALELEEGMKVLEIGAGSGYHAATIAELVGTKGHVFSIEKIEDLVQFARKNLERSGYTDRVTLIPGDGTLGYADRAPFDRIVVTAASPDVPPPLLEQLKPDGLIVLPIGGKFFPQELVLVRKGPTGTVEKKRIGGVAFVPLVGKYGFED